MPNILTLKEKINQIPKLPGIYKFYNADGTIIYIGKSKCLKKRVKSYFAKTPKWEKVKKLVCFIRDIEYIVTDTHLEALLLECELIKMNKPYFNAQMKNDQRYVYLKISDYNNSNSFTVVSEKAENTYGPFRSRYTLIDIIDSFKSLYPIKKSEECYIFEYHLLPVSMDKTIYTENRNTLLNMLSENRNIDLFLNQLEEKMKEAASLYKYETASRYRDIISGFKYIQHGISAYQNLLTSNILLKIPFSNGFKLFYISSGTILLKERFPVLTQKDINSFIKKGKSKPIPEGITLSNHSEVVMNEKMRIDFRDILCSEIMALPDEMVQILQ